jgi:hypothetical protein
VTTYENGTPETPDWVCPVRPKPEVLTIPPNVILAEN